MDDVESVSRGRTWQGNVAGKRAIAGWMVALLGGTRVCECFTPEKNGG